MTMWRDRMAENNNRSSNRMGDGPMRDSPMRAKQVRSWSLAILVLAFQAIGLDWLQADSNRPPNIVLIFADDLGFGDLGCYGHPYAQTPTIDRLAHEGTRFTQAYVTGVTCCPSRTGLMTGLFPARFQKYPAGYGFGTHLTITDLLQQHGYRTGHFGKWHIGPDQGGVYGIDEFRSGANTKDDPRGRDAGLFDQAVQFIKRNADGPFYVNVWGHATHYPVNTHPDLVAEFDHVSVDRNDFSSTMQHKFDECTQIGGSLDHCMQHYLGDLLAIDRNVNRLLQTIDSLGIREDTIVVFSSDHGPAPVLLGNKKRAKEFSANMLGSPGEFRGGKHEQYEGGIRVPLIVRWPGRVKSDHTDHENVVSLVDWLPTLCTIVGIEELPPQLDGEDVSDIWLGARRQRTKPLFWKTNSVGSAPVMREGNWKLHANKQRRGRFELYDLSIDPSESDNVADQLPTVVRKLGRKLDAWVAELPKSYLKTDKQRGRPSEDQN